MVVCQFRRRVLTLHQRVAPQHSHQAHLQMKTENFQQKKFRLSNGARWWNLEIKVNITKVRHHQGHPVTLHLTRSGPKIPAAAMGGADFCFVFGTLQITAN